MIYRTVTVTPALTDDVGAEASIKGNAISVTAETGKNISVDADLTSSVIAVTADVSANIKADAELITKLQHGDLDPYDGPYEVTPTSQVQTLLTAAKALTRNVVINPIPSNYGLITWNGSTLTVS